MRQNAVIGLIDSLGPFRPKTERPCCCVGPSRFGKEIREGDHFHLLPERRRKEEESALSLRIKNARKKEEKVRNEGKCKFGSVIVEAGRENVNISIFSPPKR